MNAQSEQSRRDSVESPRKGFAELVREGCEGYVRQGIGLPVTAYLFHGVKLCLFVLGWMFFCGFTPGLDSSWHFGSWWPEGIAFQKAFIWACLVEVLGCGCMSGPLGFHIWPPFTAFLHFLRPGTIKLAPFPNLPLFGGTTRTWVDVLLYGAFVASLVRALVAVEIGAAQLVPIVVLLPLCGVGDKTILLAARVEHHFAMIVCFLLAGNWVAGCKAVQLAIWFWAGVSKLTVAFGYVIPVMTVNNPLVRSPSLRRRMFVSYPADLTPSRLGKTMAHAGTFLEFAAPLTARTSPVRSSAGTSAKATSATTGCDCTVAIEQQIERFAPGFRERVLARHRTHTADFERENPNDVGGAITGGVSDLFQFFTRPVARLDPYSTPHPRLFICSASTPPGGGVHGMCGYFAAQSARRMLDRLPSSLPDLEGEATASASRDTGAKAVTKMARFAKSRIVGIV